MAADRIKELEDWQRKLEEQRAKGYTKEALVVKRKHFSMKGRASERRQYAYGYLTRQLEADKLAKEPTLSEERVHQIRAELKTLESRLGIKIFK